MGGRVVLTRGPFGSGKTLLSLRMAVEVARKGGVAWVMALEQTDEECLYALESVGISTRCDAFRVFQGLGESYVAFAQSSPARGALVLLRGCQTPEGNLEDFLGTVSERLHWMEHYPLRLLIVDPINALAPPKSFTNRGLRGATRKMFEIAKLAGVNIWLTSERTLHPREDRFEENIADTVIHLDVERDGGQQIRYVEITKSRFQHECSGRHSFVIDSADGPHIYLSSSAFRSTLPPERGLALGEKTEFGVSGIDPLLGKDAVRPGDVIVLAGPGKAKTLLGVQFILAKLAEADYRCVIVSDYSQARLERYLKQQVESRSDIPNSALDRIERCRIQVGYTDPGEVLLNIEQRLRHCSSSRPCARALVTNLARWEEEMPLIRKDPGFAVALVALFRSYGIATICVCGDEIDRNKSLITDILSDQSDFLLHFYRKEMKGRSTTLISAVKSRLMQHRREMFELTVSDARLEVVPAPLFRTTAGGEIYPVKVRLFLKAETPNQKKYTERILNSLIATISPDVTVVPQEKSYDPAFMTMAQYSAVDELQILQLDEFQISRGTFATAPPYLTTFERAKGGDLLDNVYGGFADRVCCDSGKKFFAVPFYGNISFLAFQHDAYKRCGVRLPGGKLPGSWAELARLCDLWEGTRQARKNESLFFSCPVYEDSVETYNCLYFEILYSLVPDQFRKSSDLVELLSLPAAVEAASLFRRLCRRSHAFGYGSKTPDARRQPAVFWRHWYNTLNQELSDMEPSERAGVRVQPLFGNVTTAGEWYLAIPSHSACPEIGLHIIERLTTPDREMLRLRLGVGLPTRADFYEEGQSGGNDDDGVKVSPYFGFGRSELATLVRNAIRRSSFSLYQRCSRTFSSHLQWILEVPEPKPKRRHQDVAVYEELARTIKDLVAHLIVLRGKK
jgi:KaiC/GvpD/RAD55 family RecA-like ATPase